MLNVKTFHILDAKFITCHQRRLEIM